MKKKIIIMGLLVSIKMFAITTIDSGGVYDKDNTIGDFYIAKMDSNSEKNMKFEKEKENLKGEEDFKILTSSNKKGGVIFMASYITPFDRTMSFKGFCGDKYISVYGDYIYSDELKKDFLKRVKKYGYEF